MANNIRRLVIVGNLFVLLGGCSLPPANERGQQGFWTQHVSYTGWGISGVTASGPWTIGYVHWQRNMTPDTATGPVGISAMPTK